jgi:microsomal dipeptidase-like Zn-dependent dipeptidase
LLLLTASLLALLLLLSPDVTAASECGSAGQRACCIESTERLTEGTGGCRVGLAEVTGCSGDCACGGLGLAPTFGFRSSSQCVGVTECGGEFERACCTTETRNDDNPVPLSAGCNDYLTEVPFGLYSGPDVGSRLCGNTALLWFSNGACVPCGTDRAQACSDEDGNRYCRSDDLIEVGGICYACGAAGQGFCGDGMCNESRHPDGQSCAPDTAIDEPNCNCAPEAPPEGAAVNGYADLHLHMFANLGFGGLTVWGEPFNEYYGISQALRGCNMAQYANGRPLNFNVVKGVHPELVLPDPLRLQTPIHGDFHMSDMLGMGNGQHGLDSILPTGGVEWDPAYANGHDHFVGWPRWNSVTHQQVYYKWLERAFKGGLKLAVMLAVTNEAACATGSRIADSDFDCNDSMRSIDLQLERARDFETFLDRSCQHNPSGGDCALGSSNQGWFEIVESPTEARAAIANGQLAVVLGIEVADLFGCSDGNCTPESVRADLDDYYSRGVRHIFPVHNFDNDFGAAATWHDIIAIGDRYVTGKWFEANECPMVGADLPPASDDGYGFKLFSGDLGDVFLNHVVGATFGIEEFVLPYPGVETTCNAHGNTPLGTFLIQEMMSKGMIIDVDHMSVRAKDEALVAAEAHDYPGVVASHALMFELTEKSARHERMTTREDLQRIASLGGMVAAMTQPPVGGVIQPPGSKVVNNCPASDMTWAQSYEYAVKVMSEVTGVAGYPVAFGTDFNGISRHNSPRFGDDATGGPDDPPRQCGKTGNRIPYPFTLRDPVSERDVGVFDKQSTGGRSFDFNEDGLAHVGLLPDMVRDMEALGLAQSDLKPLWRSAEAYIAMWERAEGAATSIEPLPTSDSEAPTVTVTVTPQPNAAGWHNETPTVTVHGEDAGVGVAKIALAFFPPPGRFDELTIDFVAGDTATISDPRFDEPGWIFLFFAIDYSGNGSEYGYLELNVDKTPPAVALDVTPEVGPNGWYLEAVHVAPLCSDALSGLASCALSGKPDGESLVLDHDGADQLVSATARDIAGNLSQVSASFKVDLTPPSIVASVSPAANAAGWHRGDVLVSFTCADPAPPGSGLASCSSPETVVGEGPELPASGRARDVAGHVADTHLTLKIDHTAPQVEVTGIVDGATYTLGSVPVGGCKTEDLLSGVDVEATSRTSGGTALGVGDFELRCGGATDVAGNLAPDVAVHYAVHFDFSGPFAPVEPAPSVNVATAGQVIPLQFGLGGNQGLGIFRPGRPASVPVPCAGSGGGEPIPASYVGGDVLTYQVGTANYLYRWQTERSWRGTCRDFLFGLIDGSSHTVRVNFR